MKIEDAALSCEVITDFSRLEELSPLWQEWTRGNEPGTIFQQWGWIRAYWQAYGSGMSLYSLAIHDGATIRGILPLARKGGDIVFLGPPESDYNDLVCESGWAAPVLQAALDFLLQSSSAVLDWIPQNSRIVRNIPNLRAETQRHLQLVFRCEASAIQFGQNRAEVLRELMAKKDLKRHFNRAQRLGRLEFRHVERREEAREHLYRFFHQHITRWVLNGERSQFLAPERRAFFEALIDEFDPAEELRFGVLELDGRPVAYQLGFLLNGEFTYYKPAFDVNAWDACPGDVLLRKLFEYAGQAGVNEFDFSIGEESYKYRFANQVRDNYTLYVERFPGSVKSRCKTVVRHALDAVRRKPAVKAVFKRGIQVVNRTAALGAGGLLAFGFGSVRAAYSKLICARNEVLVFSSSAESAAVSARLNISPAKLDVLAVLALEYPGAFDEAKLRDYRERLKRGDKVFMARDGGNQAFLLWVGTRGEISLPDIGNNFTISLPRIAPVLYDYWQSPQFAARQLLPAMFRALVPQCEGTELYVYTSPRQEGFRRAIEEAGFRLRRHVQHRSLLHWFRRTDILISDDADNPPERRALSSVSLDMEL